jgi:WD40 repeat protein
MKIFTCSAFAVLVANCVFAQTTAIFSPEWDANVPTNQKPSAIRGLVLSGISEDNKIGLTLAADKKYYLWDLQKRSVLPVKLISYDALKIQSRSASIDEDERRWLRGYFFKGNKPYALVTGYTTGSSVFPRVQAEIWDLEATTPFLKLGKTLKDISDIIQSHTNEIESDSSLKIMQDIFFTNTFPWKVNNCELLPDNKTLIVCSGNGEDWNEIVNNLSTWDLETGQAIRIFSGAKGAIYDFALTHDGTKVLAGGFDMDLHLWDTRSGKLLVTLSRGKIIPKGMETTWDIGKVALTENGKFAAAASGSGLVFVWDVRSQKLLGPPLRFLNPPFSNWPPELAFDPRGKHLAVASRNKIFFYSLPNLQQVDVLEGKQTYPTKIVFLDNQTLAISSVEGSEGVITRFWTLKY